MPRPGRIRKHTKTPEGQVRRRSGLDEIAYSARRAPSLPDKGVCSSQEVKVEAGRSGLGSGRAVGGFFSTALRPRGSPASLREGVPSPARSG